MAPESPSVDLVGVKVHLDQDSRRVNQERGSFVAQKEHWGRKVHINRESNTPSSVKDKGKRPRVKEKSCQGVR